MKIIIKGKMASRPYLGIVLYIVQYVLLCKEKWANNANKIVELIKITFYFRQLGTKKMIMWFLQLNKKQQWNVKSSF